MWGMLQRSPPSSTFSSNFIHLPRKNDRVSGTKWAALGSRAQQQELQIPDLSMGLDQVGWGFGARGRQCGWLVAGATRAGTSLPLPPHTLLRVPAWRNFTHPRS